MEMDERWDADLVRRLRSSLTELDGEAADRLELLGGEVRRLRGVVRGLVERESYLRWAGRKGIVG